MSEPCYFCGELKPVAFALRDEKGDHPVCKDCGDEWADSGHEWPQKTTKTKVIPPDNRRKNY